MNFNLNILVTDFVDAQGTIVDACNEVCRRTAPERKECCRAHGYRLGRRFNCNGGRMICY